MDWWSNIECAPNDPEINRIAELEKTLGRIPSGILKIRELITRFEVCHFKYQQHIRNIKKSIASLQPVTDPGRIGEHHIKHGEAAAEADHTGRSRLGQKYINALNGWLGKNPAGRKEAKNQKFNQRIAQRLGTKHPEKENLVRLLIARMMWDWESYEQLRNETGNTELQMQCCRMDICHYAFPENLDLLIAGIGDRKPVKAFEGCGSFSKEIKSYIQKESTVLKGMLKSILANNSPERHDLYRAWLYACMIKTMKEQTGLSLSVMP